MQPGVEKALSSILSERGTNRRKTGKIEPLDKDDFININISGAQYRVLKRTLGQFSDTLLGNETRLRQYYVDFLDAYYFDRHREAFDSILYYYQSGGSLVRPVNIPMDLFIQEVRFFGIAEETVLNLQLKEGYIRSLEDEVDELPQNYWQEKIWCLFEYPDSSILARILAFFSTVVILASITTFCVETYPQYHSMLYEHGWGTKTISLATVNQHNVNNCTTNSTTTDSKLHDCMESQSSRVSQLAQVIRIVDILSNTWFSLEYIVRFASSPKKYKFATSFLNFIDLLAVFPSYIIMAIETAKHGSSFGVIKVARLVRVLRVFKLSRHSMGLQILGNTLRACANELAMILFMMSFSIIIFSSAIYYAEHNSGGEKKDQFVSIPDTFWYTLITMV